MNTLRKLFPTLIIIIFISSNCISQNNEIKTLSIRGTAELNHKPDFCEMVFYIKAYGKTRDEIRSIIKKRVQNLNKMLGDFKYIEYSKITFNPETIGKNRDREFSKNEMMGSKRIEIPMKAIEANLNSIAKSIFEAELDIEYYINYYFSTSLKDSLNNEVLKKAISNAKQKAFLISEQMGVKTTQILKIDFNSDNRDRYSNYQMRKIRTSPLSDNIKLISIPEKSLSEEINIIWKIE